MHRSITFLVAIFITLSGIGQPEVIGSIDGEPLFKEEFERLYRKNNQGLMEDSDKKTPLEYVELFINYKLKVHEAKQLGMDTIASFVRELETYRQEIARFYLTEVRFSQKKIVDAYERMTKEIKAGHILLKLDENASPEDTLMVFNKIMRIREQALAGENFENLAQQFSEDPSAKNNKGTLGYFSAFQMVFPFENAAYKTPVGEISMPVRTRFGYHLIHVLDKRKAKGQIKVAHIMKGLGQGVDEEYSKRKKQQIDSIATRIKSGEDFFSLARKFSDDRRSADQGGVMSWFSSTSGMIPEFSEAAFALKNDGDVSPVFRTPYGFHIIKRIELNPIAPFEKKEQFIIDEVRENPHISKHNKKLFINKLKNEYEFELDQNSLADLKAENMDEIEKPDQILFHFEDQQVTIADFVSYLKSQKKEKLAIDQHLQNFVEDQLTAFEDKNLENKYPDFKYLMKEYHDGILLFNISEQKIWSTAAKDSVGLKAYYRKNKNKYRWEERFSGWVIECPDQEVKDLVDNILLFDSELSKEELASQVKQHLKKEVNVEKGFFEQGDHVLVDYRVWDGPKPESYQDGLHFIHGHKIAPQAKTLHEAKGLYISDYQNYLEKEWVKQLRKKYNVKINKKVIKSVEPV